MAGLNHYIGQQLFHECDEAADKKAIWGSLGMEYRTIIPQVCVDGYIYCLAFGHDPPAMVRPGARRLKTGDQRVVKKYLKVLHARCDAKHLYKRAESLEKVAIQSDQANMEYEKINQLFCEARLYAERYCREFRCGGVEWSLQWQMNTRAMDFWNACVRRLQGKHIKMSTIKRRASAAGLEHLH